MAFAGAACSSDGDTNGGEDATPASSTAEPGSDKAPRTDRAPASLDLSVRALPASLAPLSEALSKYVDVWGVNIVGTANTEDRAILEDPALGLPTVAPDGNYEPSGT